MKVDAIILKRCWVEYYNLGLYQYMLVKAMCYFNMDVESYRPGQHPITIFLLMQVKHIESRFALVISDYEEK